MILAEDIGSVVGLGVLISIGVATGLIFLVNTFLKNGSITQRIMLSLMIFVVVTIVVFGLFVNLIGYF